MGHQTGSWPPFRWHLHYLLSPKLHSVVLGLTCVLCEKTCFRHASRPLSLCTGKDCDVRATSWQCKNTPLPTPFTLQPRIVATLGPPDKVTYVFTSYSSFDMNSFSCFLSVCKNVFMKDTTPSTATCLVFSHVYSLLCRTGLTIL